MELVVGNTKSYTLAKGSKKIQSEYSSLNNNINDWVYKLGEALSIELRSLVELWVPSWAIGCLNEGYVVFVYQFLCKYYLQSDLQYHAQYSNPSYSRTT